MGVPRLTEEQIAYIIELYAPPSILTISAIIKKFYEKYNKTIHSSTVSRIASKYNILRPYRVVKGVPIHQYTKEQHEFLVKYYQLYDRNILTKMFNETFNENRNPNAVQTYLEKHHISSPRSGKFEKGNIPFNKGVPLSEWMSEEGIERIKATQFDKEKTINNSNYNHKNVGDEYVDCYGYIHIKVGYNTGNKAQRFWKMKHHLVWEQNYGPIPKGHKIIFLDGNPLNCDISNLKCVADDVHLYMNQYGFYKHSSEVTEAGIAVCESELAYNKIMKGE